MKTIILLLLVLFPFIINGQENYMSLSFGGIIPIGEFGSKINLSENGFALKGLSGDYSGAFFLNKHLGIGGNIKYASNSINEKAVADLLWNETRMITQDTSNYIFKTGMWNQIAITIGPEVTFSAEKLNIDLFALGGINFVMPPVLSVNLETNNELYTREFETNSVSYGIDLGVALRYHLSNQTSLRLHCSYFRSTINGEITKLLIDDTNETIETEDFNCAMKTLNFGIGIVYRL